MIENARKFPFLYFVMNRMKEDSVKRLTTLIGFYENEHSAIATKHLAVGITSSTTADIYQSIKDVLVKKNSNVTAFASDTCNVMKAIRTGVIREYQPKVLDIHCMYMSRC